MFLTNFFLFYGFLVKFLFSMDFQYFVSNILPILTTISLFVVGYFLKGIDRRFEQVEKRFNQHDKRIEKVEDEIKLIHKDIGEIKGQIGELKGLMTGYFSRPSERN